MTDGYLSKDREHLAKLHRERGARMLESIDIRLCYGIRVR